MKSKHIYMSKNVGKFLADPKNDLKRIDLKVFLSLTSRVQYGEKIKVTQKELAEKLGVQRSRISESITKLQKLNILTKKRNQLNVLEYQFNPAVIMKGSGSNKKQKTTTTKTTPHLRVINGKNL